MKKIKAIAVVALTIIAVSCSKSKDDATISSPVKDKKLEQVTYTNTDGSTETELVTYDAQGRLATNNDGVRLYEFSYETAALLKVTRKKVSDGSVDQVIECTLNDKGAITKMVYTSMPANTISYTYEIGYDANGSLNKWKGISPDGSASEEIFEIVNGNAVSSKLYHSGVLYHNRSYMFDLSKANKGNFLHWGIWPSKTLFGKPNTNLQNEYKSINPAGQLTWHTTTSYEFDADGFPKKMITNLIHLGQQSSAVYVFK